MLKRYVKKDAGMWLDLFRRLAEGPRLYVRMGFHRSVGEIRAEKARGRWIHDD